MSWAEIAAREGNEIRADRYRQRPSSRIAHPDTHPAEPPLPKGVSLPNTGAAIQGSLVGLQGALGEVITCCPSIKIVWGCRRPFGRQLIWREGFHYLAYMDTI